MMSITEVFIGICGFVNVFAHCDLMQIDLNFIVSRHYLCALLADVLLSFQSFVVII